jgi:hypothetical protein
MMNVYMMDFPAVNRVKKIYPRFEYAPIFIPPQGVAPRGVVCVGRKRRSRARKPSWKPG